MISSRMKKNNFLFAPLRLCGLVLVGCLLFACGHDHPQKKAPAPTPLLLPVYGPKVAKAEGDTTYHTIADFSFTNQYGEKITQKTTEGKIYVADFFFTTCENICPAMSTQLIRVQDATKNDPEVLILSHSVNPIHDTVEVLQQYASKYKAIKDKWHLLTGDKKDINAMAEKSYLISAQDDGTPEGFVHSEKFILVDKQRRIRGVYDGTDSLQVDLLVKDIATLKKEK